MPLETSAEILAKKLGYRMITHGQLVPRDLYDLAVARRHDPRALENAFQVLTTGELEDINTELRYLPADWMKTHPQQLIDPASSEDAAGAVRIVHRLVEHEIRSRMPPRPGITPAWER